MLLRKEEAGVPAQTDAQTVLGKGCVLDGELELDGSVRIDGAVNGKIRAKETVVVSVGAQVVAEVSAAIVVVYGTVEGDIRATSLIELHPPARVKGTLEAPTLTIEKGVFFEGTCKMEPAGAAQSARPGPQLRVG